MTELRTDATQEGTPQLSTQPAEVVQAEFGVVGWLRWAWRTLTSMRTALILLFLLALASIPGSIFPQRGSNPILTLIHI